MIPLFDRSECQVRLPQSSDKRVSSFRQGELHKELRALNSPDVIEAYEADMESLAVLENIEANPLPDKYGQAIHYCASKAIFGQQTVPEKIEVMDPGMRKNLGVDIEAKLLDLMGWREGSEHDFLIADVEVECKWSLTNSWMVGKRQQGALCLLGCMSEQGFSFGLFRARPELLGKPNQDSKRGLSRDGRKNILWLAHDHPLPSGEQANQHFLQLLRGELEQAYGADALRAVWE